MKPSTAIRSINVLFPPFRELLQAGLQKAHKTGLRVYPFETLRLGFRQEFLYAQGRTRPGFVVTSAKPGFSWHQYGLATDLVFDGSAKPGVQWSWDGDYVGSRKRDYAQLGDVMQRSGLEWLGASTRFREMPHFQKTWGLTIYEAYAIAQKYGIMGVWLELERRMKA